MKPISKAVTKRMWLEKAQVPAALAAVPLAAVAAAVAPVISPKQLDGFVPFKLLGLLNFPLF